MIRRAAVLLAIVGAGFTALADTGDTLRAGFVWRQRLEGAFEPDHLCRVMVPGEVFDGCRVFPDDLRILDDQDQQWPFYVWIPAPKTVMENVPVRLVNASEIARPERCLRQDMEVRPDARTGARREHNGVVVHTSGGDFLRRVEVLGSEDGSRWWDLGKGYLVDHRQGAEVQNRVIRYPTSTYPLLQVRVYPDARNASETFALRSVSPIRTVETAGQLEDVPLRMIEPAEDDRKDGCQVLVVDTGAGGRPVERLVVGSDEREYARAVNLYGRNAETNAWRWAASAEIHRLGEDVSETLMLERVAYRFLKLEIYHYDDPPLPHPTVLARAVPRYLVFEAGPGRRAEVYYGSERIGAPRYDLRRRATETAAAAAPVAALGPRERNTLFKTSWLSRYGSWLAAIVVALVSALVIRVIVGMLKRQPVAGPGHGAGSGEED